MFSDQFNFTDHWFNDSPLSLVSRFCQHPPCCCHHSSALIKQKNIQEEKSKSIFLASLRWLAAYILWEQSWQKAFEKFCEKYHLSFSELPAGKLCESWLFLVSQGISYSAQCNAVPVNNKSYLGTQLRATIHHLIMRPNQPPPSQEEKN